jgi:hypothetical protein
MILFVNGGTKTVYSMKEHRDHLGILLSPACGNGIDRTIASGLPWAVDNGAYSWFDPIAYTKLVEKCRGHQRHGLRWITCPDVVGDHHATLNLFDQWGMYLLRRNLPVAFVAQDGCTIGEIPWAYIQCLFIGGTTAWKLSQAVVQLIEMCRIKAFPCHVGRVNSRKRIRWCFDQGVASVDGTSMSRFSEIYLPYFASYIAGLKQQEIIPLPMPPRALLWPSSPRVPSPQIPHDAEVQL